MQRGETGVTDIRIRARFKRKSAIGTSPRIVATSSGVAPSEAVAENSTRC